MSTNSRELELKFETDAAGFAAALGSPLLAAQKADSPARVLSSTYFDTQDQALRQHRMALRIRRAGRAAPILTVKWPPHAGEGPFARGEAEVRTPTGAVDLSLFDKPIAEELHRLLKGVELTAQFETRVKRRVRVLKYGGASIEAAFDQGEIVAGDRRKQIIELELELKSGDQAEFFEFAMRLAAELPLRLSVASKAEQAFMFADEDTPAPVKAQQIVLPAGTTFDDAIALLANGAIMHFLSNFAALREGDDPEAIHQMRVALRRLRTALAIFHKAAPSPEFMAIREEAKRIATALGPARDCDAFRALIENGPRDLLARKDVLDDVSRLIASHRGGVYREARALIDSAQITIFATRLQTFIARRGWRNSLSAEDMQRLTDPADILARQSIERLHKRVLKRARKLASQSDEQRHELRIALKNLRYGVEFFWSVLGDERAARKFIRSAADLQEVLGLHNDAAGVEAFLPRLASDASEKIAFAKGVLLGWYGHGAVVSRAELARAWKKFNRADHFWR